jgi:hypothetical protein
MTNQRRHCAVWLLSLVASLSLAPSATSQPTVVASADDFVGAMNSGVEHIILENHLDLRSRFSVDAKSNWVLGAVHASSTLKSIRVRCREASARRAAT